MNDIVIGRATVCAAAQNLWGLPGGILTCERAVAVAAATEMNKLMTRGTK